MSKNNSEYLILIRRSVFWLAIMAVIVCGTYFFQGEIWKNNLNILPASVATKELPIYSVKTDKPQVSLSFDAAWGNEDTQHILDTLKKYDIKVTFFMTGGWVDAYPDDVKAIFDAGHDLGNHSESHKHMSQLNVAEMDSEINKVTDKVKKLTEYTMFLFRPPYGDYNNKVIIQTKKCGYYPIQWSVDSLDWKNYGVDSIIDTVLNHRDLKNGAIILMHNGAKYTAKALPKVIEGLKEKGFEIVPISQLIYRENYHMEHDGSQVNDQETTSNSSTTDTTTKPNEATSNNAATSSGATASNDSATNITNISN